MLFGWDLANRDSGSDDDLIAFPSLGQGSKRVLGSEVDGQKELSKQDSHTTEVSR